MRCACRHLVGQIKMEGEISKTSKENAKLSDAKAKISYRDSLNTITKVGLGL
jgi:hypothetical protein